MSPDRWTLWPITNRGGTEPWSHGGFFSNLIRREPTEGGGEHGVSTQGPQSAQRASRVGTGLRPAMDREESTKTSALNLRWRSFSYSPLDPSRAKREPPATLLCALCALCVKTPCAPSSPWTPCA